MLEHLACVCRLLMATYQGTQTATRPRCGFLCILIIILPGTFTLDAAAVSWRKGKGGEWEERTDGIMQILLTFFSKRARHFISIFTTMFCAK